MKVSLDGKPDESHKALNPKMLAEANEKYSAFERNVEDYSVDFSTIFGEIFDNNPEQNQSVVAVEATVPLKNSLDEQSSMDGVQQHSFDTMEQSSLYSTEQQHSYETTMSQTTQDSRLGSTEHTTDLRPDFFDFLDDPFTTASNTCTEVEPAKVDNIDLVDDLLNILSGNEPAENTNNGGQSLVVNDSMYAKADTPYEASAAKVPKSSATTKTPLTKASTSKSTTTKSSTPKASTSKATTPQKSSTKTPNPTASNSSASTTTLFAKPEAKLPTLPPVLTKCLEHIKKAKNKRTPKIRPKSTDTKPPTKRNTHKIVPVPTTNHTSPQDVTAWMRSAEMLRPSQLAQRIKAGKMGNTNSLLIRGLMGNSNQSTNGGDNGKSVSNDTQARQPTATITSKEAADNAGGIVTAIVSGDNTASSLESADVEDDIKPFYSLNSVQNAFSMPTIDDYPDIGDETLSPIVKLEDIKSQLTTDQIKTLSDGNDGGVEHLSDDSEKSLIQTASDANKSRSNNENNQSDAVCMHEGVFLYQPVVKLKDIKSYLTTGQLAALLEAAERNDAGEKRVSLDKLPTEITQNANKSLSADVSSSPSNQSDSICMDEGVYDIFFCFNFEKQY